MRYFASIMAAAALTAALAEPNPAADPAAPAAVAPAAGIGAAIDTASAAAPAATIGAIAAAAGSAASSDSAADAAIGRLKRLNAGRAAVYSAADTARAARFNPSSHTQAGIFRGDGSGLSEILRYRALTSVSIPFSLSSSLNRLLPYGNTARGGYAASLAEPSAPFLPYSPRFFGSDAVSGSEASGVSANPTGGAPYPMSYVPYLPYPAPIASPEFSVFWENGVFSQNTLNLRLSRPLSPSLTLNAFTNYRYIEGRRFSHEGNGVMDLYRSLYADTSAIMNKGYNPHVDERTMGASLLRTNADSSKTYALFSYANLQNEYALNLPAQELDRLEWAALDRRIYKISASLLDKQAGPLRADIKTAIASEALKSSYEPDSAIANGKGGALSFIANAGFTLPNNIGLGIESMVKNMEFFDGDEKTFSEHHAVVFYKHTIRHPFASSALYAYAGTAALIGDDTLYVPVYLDGYANVERTDIRVGAVHAAPKGGASIELFSNSNSVLLNVFAKLDPYAVYPDYEAPRYGIPRYDVPKHGVFYNASRLTVGAEGQARARNAGLLLGYQYAAKEDFYLMRSLWPEGYPPYLPPKYTVVVAPWIERIHGFSLLSRAAITDAKPFLKASASLSYIIRPTGMAHTFETELGFDYWSEGEEIFMGGHYYGNRFGADVYGWNEPIYDLNLKITAHIKTFRLFYKIDNLLNRKLSYVPGYFSPGVTFRWGINWFIL
jgi:hypothetical protein